MPTTEISAAWWSDLAVELDALPEPHWTSYDAARERQDTLTKPQGALGRLEEIACWLAGWQDLEKPRVDTAQMAVFAGNHGVAEQGVSPFPSSVTAQMVENFRAGGAAICQLCEASDITLDVLPLALEQPTADFSLEPAMSVADCREAIAQGRQAVRNDIDILLLGEMGIANTTAAAALCHVLLGQNAQDWCGPGTGLDSEGVRRKAEIVAKAAALHVPEIKHPFDALRRLGGRELAAIAGAVLEARKRRIPVLLDGYVCWAAALVLERAKPGALDHCLAGHVSAEPAHAHLLDMLDKEPLLDLGMRLGEGTGAAVALGILRCAVAAHNGMATFAQAQVDNRN